MLAGRRAATPDSNSARALRSVPRNNFVINLASFVKRSIKPVKP